MRRIAFSLLTAAAGLAMSAGAAHAAHWSKAYAVEWIEPAFYFGPKDTKAADAKGEDCPNGINPELDYQKLLEAAGYPADEVKFELNPENRYGKRTDWSTHRGPNKENIYQNPTAWPDPGMIQVTGNIGEGFDLDGNPETGFVSPDGKTRGIDNKFYKVGGCTLRWRGAPRDAYYHKYANDGMRDGKYTILIVISGDQDPMNDPNAKIGFYTAKDKLVKDGMGNIAADYTFHVDPDPRYQSVVGAKITGGVIELQGRPKILMHDYPGDSRVGGQLPLIDAKISLRMTEDGLKGYVGGYMPIDLIYRENSDYIRELTGHMSAPALYYALNREADGVPDPKTGKNTAISTAYRIDAVPAFAVTPSGDADVTVARAFEPDAEKLAQIAADERRLRARQEQRNAPARVANNGTQ
jgi:hypothetical protein